MQDARILVVDDDPDYADILVMSLTEAGCRRIRIDTGTP